MSAEKEPEGVSLAEVEQPPPQTTRWFFYLKAAVMCVLYITVGPTLIVLNKYILSNLKFPFPITLSSLGQVFIAVVTWGFVKTGHGTISEEASSRLAGHKGALSCILVGLFKALTLSFGNAVYLYLTVAYIQMLKAFSPVLMLFLLVVTGVERAPRVPVALSVVMIAVFTAATTAFETKAHPIGLLYMVLAQLTEGLAIVLTQFLLKNKKLTILESQYFLAPPAVLCLGGLAVVSGEWAEIVRSGKLAVVQENPLTFSAAATLGLVVNYLTFAVIQETSGTMLKVLATVRNTLTVFVGAAMFSEHVGLYEGISYSCTLGGFVSYTYFSMQGVGRTDRQSDNISPPPLCSPVPAPLAIRGGRQ